MANFFIVMYVHQILDTPSLIAEGAKSKKNIFKDKPANDATTSCCWY